GDETPMWGEVVGVANDVLAVDADTETRLYQLYQPMAQEPQSANEIAVLTTGVAPSTLVAGIRSVMMSLDPDLPVR
ncbi:MAG: hypothetical protein ACRD88_13560, partial [Terriglobia bacterium]